MGWGVGVGWGGIGLEGGDRWVTPFPSTQKSLVRGKDGKGLDAEGFSGESP